MKNFKVSIKAFCIMMLVLFGMQSNGQDCNTNCTTGSINLNAKNSTNSAGGVVQVKKTPSDGTGGEVSIYGGNGVTNGANVKLEAGSGGTTAGKIILKGGDLYGSTNDGSVEIQRGTLKVLTKMVVGTNEIQNDDALLIVVGKIACEEVEVKSVSADYVFSSDYNLKSLQEVEAYIKANKHLPDIPPAEVTEKGVNLSEFSEKLLQKVEELTLYVIDLKKENEELRNRIEQVSGTK